MAKNDSEPRPPLDMNYWRREIMRIDRHETFVELAKRATGLERVLIEEVRVGKGALCSGKEENIEEDQYNMPILSHLENFEKKPMVRIMFRVIVAE